MKLKYILNPLGIFISLLLFGCHSTSSQGDFLRLAKDPPEFFEPPSGMEFNEESCLNPLTDPRDGTIIILEKSYGNGLGDFKVMGRKYSVGSNELLRVNCKTGKVVGVVKK